MERVSTVWKLECRLKPHGENPRKRGCWNWGDRLTRRQRRAYTASRQSLVNEARNNSSFSFPGTVTCCPDVPELPDGRFPRRNAPSPHSLTLLTSVVRRRGEGLVRQVI